MAIATFLTDLFEQGLRYSLLNVVQNALPSLAVLPGGASFGTPPLIASSLKGAYTWRPLTKRYMYTLVWDVKIVLEYARYLLPAYSH